MPIEPLARANKGRALAAAASNSASMPGLTSISAISVTMDGSSRVTARGVLNQTDAKKKAAQPAPPTSRPDSRLAEQQRNAPDGHRASHEQQQRPAALRATIAAFGAAQRNQGVFILVR